jgi:predicted adenylyl cyclase CyaB
MNEIEVKILDVNKSEVIENILKLGGKLISENKIYNAVFFESPENQVIRIRQEGDTVVICHKNKLKSETGAKIMEETEIETNNFETAIKLLQNLGHKLSYGGIKKTRTSYKLNNCKIEFDKMLDKFEFVPEFLEIEGTSEQDIFQIAEQLGFSKEQCLNWGANKVIEHYKK